MTAKKMEIEIEFVESNNKVKVGDVVTNHSTTLSVKKITYYVSFFDIPGCVYYGPRLTKTGAPYKSGEHATIYQHNLKKQRDN